MSRPILPSIVLSLLALGAGAGAGAAQLTETELRWLRAGAPVLDYAKSIGLPIDIVVQPQAGPDDVPIAMGFDGGRCKLVLSMRGNPGAETILDPVPEAARAVMIEAMTAHEVGHCWRYAQGDWHLLPSGFVEIGQERASDARWLDESKAMRETRREEGFSDLAALAWTRARHPGDYAAVFGWIEQVRGARPLAGGTHDTLVWLHEAREAGVFQAAATPFDAALPLWRKGLSDDGR